MKRILMVSTAATVALGYSHGRAETVLISGGRGQDPIRVNKADYDADQADGGAKEMSLYKGDSVDKDDTSKTARSSDVNVTHEGEGGEVQTTAAPSAPDFSKGDAPTPPMDPVKSAAAPSSTTADQLLVMKITKGTNKGKFTIVDGLGQPLSDDKIALYDLGDNVFDTEAAAKQKQTTTEPKPVKS